MSTKRRLGTGIAAVTAGALGACLVPTVSQAVTSASEQTEAASLVDSATPQDAQPEGAGNQDQQLVFSDEFNASTVDTSKWVKGDDERTAHSGIRWWYKPENVKIGNGSLNLGISKLGENQYGGSSLTSQGKFAYKYGTIEFRMQAPPTEGHLGAAWMMPENGMGDDDNNGTGADGAEYDLTETASTSDQYPTTVHYDGYGASHRSSSTTVQAPGLHSGYHTFAMTWTPDTLQFLYDGEVVRVLKDAKLISQVKERPVLSNEILQMAEGDIADAPKDATSDAKFDYVRVWQSN